MLDGLCFGLLMPIMPDVLMDMGCSSVSDAAFYSGLLTLIFAAMQFIFGPLLGSLSDRFGRRPIMLLSLCILFVDYAIKGFAHSMWLFVVGKIVSGMGLAHYSTASAMIADVSVPKKRAVQFGLLGAAVGIGFIIGASCGSLFSSSADPRALCYLAASLALLNIIIGILFLKETFTLKKPPHAFRIVEHVFGALNFIRTTPV